MNNKSKMNTQKAKMYLTVVAMASLLVMAFNLNSNMNSSMNAYASIFENIRNADDIGQSLECVIVVVGCDGTGSVGSSGDVNVGSGDDNTNGGTTTPLPTINATACAECIEALTPGQQDSLALALGLTVEASVAEICAALDLVATVEALVVILDEAGLSATAIVALLACLDIDITLAEVTAIIGGL
ncbi:MAG: hypothetical protein H0W19_09930 [Nitrosopumilus sp.]|nr:hypothetical protein [Nitrosopumilus sp.]